MEEDNSGVENEVGKCLPLWENVSTTNQEPENQKVTEEKGDAGKNGSEIAEGKEQEVSGREVKTLGASRRISMNTRSRARK